MLISPKEKILSTQARQFMARLRKEIKGMARRQEKIDQLNEIIRDITSTRTEERGDRVKNLIIESRRLLMDVQTTANRIVLCRQLLTLGTDQQPGKIDINMIDEDKFKASDLLKHHSQEDLAFLRFSIEFLDLMIYELEVEIKKQQEHAINIRKSALQLT